MATVNYWIVPVGNRRFTKPSTPKSIFIVLMHSDAGGLDVEAKSLS